jgi:ADP-ribosylglycohydrolase
MSAEAFAESREARTVRSALWAAYGDALGFPTELANASMVRQRVGSTSVASTVPWTRLVGGRFGARVELPAGAYSDDTQLRLATSRCIRHDGFFDVESLAKIELPVWLSYALGGGLGSKAAATSLANRTSTWFSNFFRTDKATYVTGGGNGAAMRIQPHVWAARDLSDTTTYLTDVVRNAVATHGHARGIAGAMIHAVTLAHVLREGQLPGPAEWASLGSVVNMLPRVVEQDSDLRTFWLPTWERESSATIQVAAGLVYEEWMNVSSEAVAFCQEGIPYRSLVERLGGLKPEERGSGLKSALFSLCAAWMFREADANMGLAEVSNVLNSDTDTIATMAGALLGAVEGQAPPDGSIQDRGYIEFEARRLHEISRRRAATSFSYPDLLYWQAPRTPLDTIGIVGEQSALSGLGHVEPLGPVHGSKQSDTVFQWFRLPFGQTVLCKRRSSPRELPPTALPANASQDGAGRVNSRVAMLEPDLFALPVGAEVASDLGSPTPDAHTSLEDLTDAAIQSGFDARIIGKHLVGFAESENGLELAVAYAAIVVKAKRARLKRNRPR